MTFNIPVSRHSIGQEEKQAVWKVLGSDRITQGPLVEEFECKIAELCKTKYAIVFSSGSTALQAAYSAVLKPGHEMITTPLTFAATANTVANVMFADIDPETLCIDPEEVRKKITAVTKVIVPVHFAGRLCDLEKIYALADKHKLKVVEDACHAFGVIDGVRDMAVFSFHPSKTITTGEGGAVVFNDKNYYGWLIGVRDHGRLDGLVCQDGSNYRLTDIQCAIGLEQIKKVPEFLKKRRAIATSYSIMLDKPYTVGANHLYPIHTENRDELKDYLLKHGIHTQIHYRPLHMHPKYGREEKYPHAEEYYKGCLSLPIYPDLSDKEQRHVIDTIRRFYG